jgi:hypothetical protein
MQVAELQQQVGKLQSGQTSVSKEESDTLENLFSDYMTAWARRKRMFNDLWCAHLTASLNVSAMSLM